MSDNSQIEWTDATWNPIRARYLEIQNDGSGKERTGWHCEHVSDGCRHCYAERFNQRLGTGRDFKPGELYREEKKGYHNGEAKLFLDETMLTLPLRWKKPRMIFVCSMTDLFADFVPDEFIDKMVAVMALSPQHTFQVLTKRAARMKEWFAPFDSRRADSLGKKVLELGYTGPLESLPWPLPNVWLGVSTERQQEADERIPLLLDTPAAILFVSAEPLLGQLDLSRICIQPQKPGSVRAGIHLNALAGRYCESGMPYLGNWDVNGPCPPASEQRRLSWVIVGGESGPGARPMHPAWAHSLRDQCLAAGVPFFFKQWGEHAPGALNQYWTAVANNPDLPIGDPRLDVAQVTRVGKKAAGRLLDGVEHNGFPAVRG
jgi:protein gp37